MKTAPTNRMAVIAAALRNSKKPLNSREVAERTGISLKTIQNQMANVRRRYQDNWQQVLIKGVLHYAIGKDIYRPGAFKLPPDMWRGWKNPETGYQPARLGAL